MQIVIKKRSGTELTLFWPYDQIATDELRMFIRPYVHERFTRDVEQMIAQHNADMAAGAEAMRQAAEDLSRAEYEGMVK